MSKTQTKTKKDFFLSLEFWTGMIVGSILMITVGYGHIVFLVIDNWADPITAEDCKYGLHQDFFGSRCIYHSEMQEILECNEFYLRDGYWWECIE